MNVVVMEDEIRSANELTHLLGEIDPHIRVVARFDSVEQALEWFPLHPSPDLVIADIQLADGLSLDVFRQLTISSPVIFCTAYDEYILQAFDACAVSYILKPVTIEKLKAALFKLESMRQSFSAGGQRPWLKQLGAEIYSQRRSALLVNERDKIIPLPVEDIAFCYLARGSVQLHNMNGDKYSYQSSLDEMEKILDPAKFYRANRQFIINRAAVRNAERYFARKLVLRLSVPVPETVVVSKARASAFLRWLQQAG